MLSHSVVCDSLRPPRLYSPPGSSVHGVFQQEYWSGLPFPFQEIFSTQGSNSHLLYLLHWQADSLLLSQLGSPHYLIYLFQIAGFPNSFLYNKQKPQMMHCIQLQVSFVFFKLKQSPVCLHHDLDIIEGYKLFIL